MSRSSVKETEMKQAARESAARPVPEVAVLVMAAGLGKRMQSKHAKVLHPVAGRAMVLYSVDSGAARRRPSDCRHRRPSGGPRSPGHQGRYRAQERACAHLRLSNSGSCWGPGMRFCRRRPVFVEVGSLHAGAVLILNGDTPLLREATRA